MSGHRSLRVDHSWSSRNTDMSEGDETSRSEGDEMETAHTHMATPRPTRATLLRSIELQRTESASGSPSNLVAGSASNRASTTQQTPRGPNNLTHASTLHRTSRSQSTSQWYESGLSAPTSQRPSSSSKRPLYEWFVEVAFMPRSPQHDTLTPSRRSYPMGLFMDGAYAEVPAEVMKPLHFSFARFTEFIQTKGLYVPQDDELAYVDVENESVFERIDSQISFETALHTLWSAALFGARKMSMVVRQRTSSAGPAPIEPRSRSRLTARMAKKRDRSMRGDGSSPSSDISSLSMRSSYQSTVSSKRLKARPQPSVVGIKHTVGETPLRARDTTDGESQVLLSPMLMTIPGAPWDQAIPAKPDADQVQLIEKVPRVQSQHDTTLNEPRQDLEPIELSSDVGAHDTTDDVEDDASARLTDDQIASLTDQTWTGLRTAISDKVTECLDEEFWRDFCRWIGHDPRAAAKNDHVRIYGLRRHPRPAQAYAAAYIIKECCTGLWGKFLADPPGTGKTTVGLVIFVLSRHIALLYEDVARSSSSDASLPQQARHLAPGTATLPQTALVCPSMLDPKTPAGMLRCTCPCVDGSFLRKWGIRAKLGLFMVLCPLGILAKWKSEWKLVIDEGTQLNLQLVIPHESESSSPYGMSRVLQDKTALGRMGATAVELTRPTQDNHFSGAYDVQGTYDNTCTMILCTSNSIPARFLASSDALDLTVNHTTYSAHARPRPKTSTYKQCRRIAFGYILRDEHHKEWRKTSATLTALTTAYGRGGIEAIQGNPYFIPVSATPLEFSVGDIGEYLKLMQRGRERAGNADPRFDVLKETNIGRISRAFEGLADKITARGATRQELQAQISAVIEQVTQVTNMCMIRRSEKTIFFGNAIFALPPVTHSDVDVKLAPEWYERVDGYAAWISAMEKTIVDEARVRGQVPARTSAGGIKQLGSLHHRLRQIVSVPYLLTMCRDSDEASGVRLRLTQQQLRDKGWLAAPETSPFCHRIGELLGSSAKLQHIVTDVQRLMGQVDVHGEPVQQIYASGFATIALILYLVFVRTLHIKEREIAFVHPGLTDKKRWALLNAFERRDASEHLKGVDLAKDYRPRYIIAVVSSIGEGIDLVHAVHSTLVEPLDKSTQEVQLRGRHRRIGQQNPIIYTKRLYTRDNAVETRLVQQGVFRRQQDAAFRQTHDEARRAADAMAL